MVDNGTLHCPKRPLLGIIPISVAVALLGALVYALLMMRSVAVMPGAFGADIYDQLWLAIKDGGRLDLPARTLRLEGHYLPNGTGFTYQGVGPLLTRMLLDPVLNVGAAPLAPFSIWLWATAGTAFWHAAFVRVGARFGGGSKLLASLGVALWLGGPGILLTTNHALFHEAIALAYAAAGAFLLTWMRATEKSHFSAFTLVTLATLAALTVHARPNLAVGLYIATAAALVQALGLRGRAALPSALAAMAILLSGAGTYLALNKAKFGATTTVHGSFAPGDVQHGAAYWNWEPQNSPRQQGFIEHGRFNPGRILPNAAVYLAAPPMPQANAVFRSLHHAATVPRVGFVRIEAPSTGILFMWTFWAVLAGIGLCALRRHGIPFAGLLAGLTISTLLTLSYATITLRYHIDLWPLIAALALLAVPTFASRPIPTGWRGAALGIAAGVGVGVSSGTAIVYTYKFRTHEAGFFANWSAAECRERAAAKGLNSKRINYICRDPMIDES